MLVIGDDPEGQLVAFAQTWFRRVARAEWEAALAMLDEPNSDGARWTEESITEAPARDLRAGYALRRGIWSS